jgi:hypothetical protein
LLVLVALAGCGADLPEGVPDYTTEYARVMEALRSEPDAGEIARLVNDDGLKCVEAGCDVLGTFVTTFDDKLTVSLDWSKFCYTGEDLPEEVGTDCTGKVLSWGNDAGVPSELFQTLILLICDELGIPRSESLGPFLTQISERATAKENQETIETVAWDTTAGWHLEFGERYFTFSPMAEPLPQASMLAPTQRKLAEAVDLAEKALVEKQKEVTGEQYGSRIKFTCPPDDTNCTLANWFFPERIPDAESAISESITYSAESGTCGLEDCKLEGMTDEMANRITLFLAREVNAALGCPGISLDEDAPVYEEDSAPVEYCPVEGGGAIAVSWFYDDLVTVSYTGGSLSLTPTPTPIS